MRFARWIFLLSAVTGVLLIVPPFFLEARTGADYPPPINHPEYYYGFFGVTLAWQFMFLVIGLNPIRYRTAMLPSMLEKASFAIAIPILFPLERVPAVGSASPQWMRPGWFCSRSPTYGHPRRRQTR